MQPRRVLVVSDDSQIYGTMRSAENLRVPLADLGIEMTLGTPADSIPARWWTERGGAVEPLPAAIAWHAPPKMGMLRLWSAKGAAGAGILPSLVRAFRRYDLIHSNNLLVHPIALVAARMARRPLVVEMHEVLPPGMGLKVLGRTVGMADATVAISQAVRNQIPGRFQSRIHMVPQSVDLERFEWRLPPPLSDPAKLVLISRLDPGKGIDTAIQAVSELHGRGLPVHLTVVGGPSADNGQFESTLREMAASAPAGSVDLVGPRDDIPAVLQSSDMVLVPSHMEAFGLVALEGLAAGVPVVAAAVGGHLDFLEEGRCALLIPPRDADALAGAIHRMITTDGLGQSLARRGREVAERHSIHVRAERMAKVYAGAMQGARAVES